ncbi:MULTISPECIES: SDR family oxidoreductase [unclassified Streptomyces]|uniref:SDR family oxidoreductase n=1 Tax=unclassified Streptomyces TaxID=2593676 RepID=UPI002DDB990A|nr:MULTISPECIES: SDR family oxidoreductase [unclassified Streptomyces]WSF82318.1 SDR family oxidoreductase [Streptomyces sp. NBC_01744]WSC41389.1 SDR family oxidoreductase [Streptomyces sp. NBC_01763]WSC49776.1 SDR family oxidoreductase [Streptomyces sp. NBC_01762]WSC51466.1 SDR family oxidoreductase [Streptomyces sp. NBC_01761]WSD29353.1 SDR family oxidoreductase [Streptomyces sp. NBC_01751]
MTTLEGAVVLVTGGNRGIGKAIVDELLARGAKKVYATARNPQPSTDNRVVPLALEVTDPASIEALVAAAPDVTVLINNAGGSSPDTYLDAPIEDIRNVFETNFFGPLNVTRAFVPVIERNGGGHILNAHSALSWVALHGAYSATKAAFWLQTNAIRLELLDRGIGVTGLHMGYVDTDMTAAVTQPKSKPADIAKEALDGIEKGAFEVLADETSRQAKAALSGDITDLYPQLRA